MKMYPFHYKNGNYPTTMQMLITDYKKEAFQENKKYFLEKFNLKKDPYSLGKINLSKMPSHIEVALNPMGAYIVIDTKKKVVIDLAFEEFPALVWLFQVKGIDGLKFELPEEVAKAVADELKQYYSDRIIFDDKKTATKKTSTAKKPVAKKTSTAKKRAVKKTTTTKKTAAKKATTAKKPVAKKTTTSKKPAAKKTTTTKKTAAKKAITAKKPVAKKTAKKK